MTDPQTISESEWQVMQVIWEKKSALAADVIDALKYTGWSHRTIRTLLSRLVDKGILSTEPVGNKYVYRPTITKARCIRVASQSFVERVFGGDTEQLMTHFAKHGKIDAEQIERLKTLLDERQGENQ